MGERSDPIPVNIAFGESTNNLANVERQGDRSGVYIEVRPAGDEDVRVCVVVEREDFARLSVDKGDCAPLKN